jgi:DNA-binding transcriptional LysR family regulator
MQDLEPILIFITVAEMGSFTHAADSLGIQKGRASTAVRKLEEDVGVRLLHRTTRSVQLTEDGRAFHARARDLLAEVDDLHSMFAGDRVALRGRIRVDLPSEVARTTIVPALPDFMASHPELELEVSSTDRQVDLVQEGFDCVLRLGPIRDETLIARPLGLLRMVNAASPAYLARYGVLDRWKISSVRNIGQFIFRRCWAQDPMDGNTRTATATPRFSCQVRYTSTARRPTTQLPSPALA